MSCLALQFVTVTFKLDSVLSANANRQGVDISVTVCMCVCFLCSFTATDFSAEDKASGVKFLHSGSLASKAGNLTFWGTLLPGSPKSAGEPAGMRTEL